MSEATQYWSKHLAAIDAEGVWSKVYAKHEALAVASLYFGVVTVLTARLKAATTAVTKRVAAGRQRLAQLIQCVGRASALAAFVLVANTLRSRSLSRHARAVFIPERYNQCI